MKSIKKYIVFILICCAISGLSIFLYATYERITVNKSAVAESSPAPYTGEYVSIRGEHVYHRIDCPLLKGVSRGSIVIVEDDPNIEYTIYKDGIITSKPKKGNNKPDGIDWDKTIENINTFRPCKSCHPEEGAKKESVNYNAKNEIKPQSTTQPQITTQPQSTVKPQNATQPQSTTQKDAIQKGKDSRTAEDVKKPILGSEKVPNTSRILGSENVHGSSNIIKSQDAPILSSAIESRIDGDFKGWTGDTIFKLQNGQIWQQSSYDYTYHYAYSPSVIIYKSGLLYKMKVDGVDRVIYVKRLK